MRSAKKKEEGLPDITAAVLLWAWDQVLVDQAASEDAHGPRAARAVAAAKAELLRLELIDDMGVPTKLGRKVLSLI